MHHCATGILRGVRLKGESVGDYARGPWIPLKGLSDVILYGVDQNDEYLHPRLKLVSPYFGTRIASRRAEVVVKLRRMVVDGSAQPTITSGQQIPLGRTNCNRLTRFL